MVLLLLLFGLVFGEQVCKPNKQFYEDKERGWFWKEVCVKEEKKEEKKVVKEEEKKYKFLPTKTNVPWHILDRLSPEEIQKIEKETREVAIMYPTRDNVLEHMRLTRWIRDKSIRYAKLAEYYMRQDSHLAYNRPTQLPMKDALIVYRERERKRVLGEFSKKMGLLVIESENCFECHGYKQVVEMAKKEWGWDYHVVKAEERPNLTQRLGVQHFPDTFLVINEKGYPRFLRVGSGYMTLSELEDSVFLTLYMEGYVKDENLVAY